MLRVLTEKQEYGENECFLVTLPGEIRAREQATYEKTSTRGSRTVSGMADLCGEDDEEIATKSFDSADEEEKETADGYLQTANIADNLRGWSEAHQPWLREGNSVRYIRTDTVDSLLDNGVKRFHICPDKFMGHIWRLASRRFHTRADNCRHGLNENEVILFVYIHISYMIYI